ncbi:MAG: Gfo/Idh/MocA family oxidoreductase [Pirellulales bacterium]|nr:Gfo/Idh/MocA family oxidoreductase [Pirellulales bacterium]
MKRNDCSRRRFLKSSAAALGTVAFGRPLILSNAKAYSTAANSSLNLALVGCGSQGRGVMRGLLAGGANLVALCDPDEEMIAKARADAQRSGGEATKDAKAYTDYRRLLDHATSFDAVLIATPDHWHAPLCKVFMQAGKHIYCEKPLTHSVAEARELRELARTSNVVTQMGNQGSASESLRRCTEIIRSGVLGQIRQIYQWGIGVTANEGSAEGEDPIPQGFNWDLWVGPSAMRPFKKNVYHPSRWRQWFDFGNGSLADFCCHAINLPMRALDLSYPEKIVINVQDGTQIAGKAAVEFHFPARGDLPPVTLYWQGNGKPPAEVLLPLTEVSRDKVPDGLMILGEKGCIYTSHWNTGGQIRLQGESHLVDVLRHGATKEIPRTLPRSGNHGKEWLDACRGEGKTFSDFEIGGKLTEIGLAGVVGLRAGQNLDWDGEKMEATNVAEAAQFVHAEYRTKWLE